MTRGRLLGQLLLLSFGLAFSAVVGELALRLAVPDEYYVWPPNLRRTLNPMPGVMPGIDGPSNFVSNSVGIRADEMPAGDANLILAVGGSTTECLYLDQAETWTQLLQQRLASSGGTEPAWVGNAGKSGSNTAHHLLQMTRLLDRHPNVDTVLMLVGVNDFQRAITRPAGAPAGAEDRQTTRVLVSEAFSIFPNWDAEFGFIKSTEIWRLARRVRERLAGPEQHVQDDVGQVYVRLRDYRRQALRLHDDLPTLGPALEAYAGNLRAVADLAAARHVRLIFMTQPTIWRPDLPPDVESLLWFGGIGNFQLGESRDYYTVAALERGMAAYNDALLEVCRQRGVECLDLARRLPKDLTSFYDDVHFNESGAARVAEAVAEYLTRARTAAVPTAPTDGR